jgi:hypothetical protein
MSAANGVVAEDGIKEEELVSLNGSYSGLHGTQYDSQMATSIASKAVS